MPPNNYQKFTQQVEEQLTTVKEQLEKLHLQYEKLTWCERLIKDDPEKAAQYYLSEEEWRLRQKQNMKVQQDQDPAESHSSDDAADVDDRPVIPSRSYCQNWFSMMFRRFINLTSDAISGSNSWARDPWQHSGPEEMAAGFRVTSPGRSDADADTSGNLFLCASASVSASSNQAPTPPPRMDMDSLTLNPCCPTPARR